MHHDVALCILVSGASPSNREFAVGVLEGDFPFLCFVQWNDGARGEHQTSRLQVLPVISVVDVHKAMQTQPEQKMIVKPASYGSFRRRSARQWQGGGVADDDGGIVIGAGLGCFLRAAGEKEQGQEQNRF